MAGRKDQGGDLDIDRSRKEGDEEKKMPGNMPGKQDREHMPEHESGGGYGSDRGMNP